MLKNLLIARLILSFIGVFWLPLIGLGAILYTGLKQVTGNLPADFWEREQRPMLRLKSVDEERRQHGLPLLR
jgi:hypothetical protein